uniref:Uncharacterized protein n=1 Tax=Podarcis muralis TaxID=64176 RepID=A0A670K1D9_PODMU
MKLQAVMENLQRQQRARLQQEMESRQPPPADPPSALPAPAAAAMAFSRSRSQEPAAEEAGEPESARIQRAQMAALAAMREAAAGLSQSSSPGPSEASRGSAEEEEEEEEDEEDDGGVFPRETVSEDEEMKAKWADEEFDEDLGEEEEDDYDEDEEMAEEEGVPMSGEAARSSPGPPLLRKQQPTLPYRGETSRLAGGPERLSASLPHLSQVQTQPLDHGDWTYEEQFKQVSFHGRLSFLPFQVSGVFGWGGRDTAKTDLSFKSEPVKAVKVLCECLEAVGGWMAANRLRLNPDKTEGLFLGDRGRVGVEDSLVLNGVTVPLKDQVRSLGVILDAQLSMEAQVKSMCRAAISGTQDETLPARRLSGQSGACSGYLPLGLLPCALRGATFEGDPETTTNPECGCQTGDWERPPRPHNTGPERPTLAPSSFPSTIQSVGADL